MLGVGGSAAFIPFLGNMASGSSELYVQLSPNIACIALITGQILVVFSVYIPAKKVGKITEIAAIRYNPAEDLGKRSHKTKKNSKTQLAVLLWYWHK